MTATIDPINEKTPWPAHAAAGDALSRCAVDKPFLAIFVKEDGSIGYSSANNDFASLSMFAVHILEMAQSFLRARRTR